MTFLVPSAAPTMLPYPAVAESRQRLVTRVEEQVSGDGALRARCSSRVLESALMLFLLRSTGTHSARRKAVSDFLRACPTMPGTFDHRLRAAALGQTPMENARQAMAQFAEFEHFTSARKLLMFGTILAALGAGPFDYDIVPTGIRYDGHAAWVDLSLCAIRLLYVTARGGDGSAETAFLEDRLTRGSSRRAWEGHLLAHLLALLALDRHVPGHPLVRRGIADLLTEQNPDGGLPFIADFDIFCTATAGLALLASPEHDPSLLRGMADYLADRQQPDGGWAYAESVRQTDADDAAYCVQLLTALDPARYADHIRAGETFLVSLANEDGGLPTFRRGHPSEIVMTAGALHALCPHWEDHPAPAAAALEYLLAAQRPDGTFECSWSLSEANAMFRVVHALDQARHRQSRAVQSRMAQVTSRVGSRLRTAQNADGGWGQRPGDPSDPISTSYALLAAPGRGRHRALGYLLTQQQHDGGFRSRPEQAAPRPIPYDVPPIADIFPLWALGIV